MRVVPASLLGLGGCAVADPTLRPRRPYTSWRRHWCRPRWSPWVTPKDMANASKSRRFHGFRLFRCPKSSVFVIEPENLAKSPGFLMRLPCSKRGVIYLVEGGDSTTKRYLHLGQPIFLPIRLASLTGTSASQLGQGCLNGLFR